MSRSQGVLFHNTANGIVGYHEEGDEKNDGKYEGEYRNNRRNGKGKRTTPNGSIGEGEFHDGDLWNGTIMDKDGDIISKIANGVELNLLTTEVYSSIEWKENETTTRT